MKCWVEYELYRTYCRWYEAPWTGSGHWNIDFHSCASTAVRNAGLPMANQAAWVRIPLSPKHFLSVFLEEHYIDDITLSIVVNARLNSELLRVNLKFLILQVRTYTELELYVYRIWCFRENIPNTARDERLGSITPPRKWKYFHLARRIWTTDLRITVLLYQLQSSALPAELSRVVEA